MIAFAALPPSVRKGSAFPIAISFFEAAPLMSPGGIASKYIEAPVRRSLTARKAAKPQHQA